MNTPPSPLRLAELASVERKERTLHENHWYDHEGTGVTPHQSRALSQLLRGGLIELVPARDAVPDYSVACITDKGRWKLVVWRSTVPTAIYGTRRRRDALQEATETALRYDDGFRLASGEKVRPYLARSLSELLKAGLLSVREIPGEVSVTDEGLVHLDRWSDG